MDGEQRGVLAGIVAAAGVTVVALALAVPVVGPVVGPLLPRAGDGAGRLLFAFRIMPFVVLPLACCIAVMAMLRFRSPADIAGSAFVPPGERTAVPIAVLQNTLEQTMLAVVAHLGFAATARVGELALLPVLAALFCVGRLCFAIGYRHGAGGRAFGFALTFFPTIATLAWTIVRMMW